MKASDAYFANETSRFSPAHLADLFGADGKKYSAEEIKEGKRESEMRFTEALTEKMFRALDFDHDDKITQVLLYLNIGEENSSNRHLSSLFRRLN